MSLLGGIFRSIGVLTITYFFVFGAQADNFNLNERLNKIISPHIENETLFIEGVIDSHIYNYLMYDAKEVKKVKYVVLNSLGGSNDWALAAAQKLQALGITTQLLAGNVCASGCVYLFAAGKVRQADKDTWLGVHGARLGVGYTTTFQGVCFIDFEDGTSVYTPKKKGCKDFLDHWYEITFNATSEAFSFMESNGVSTGLRKTYFNFPDDSDWPDHLNVLRKPDWILQTEEAVKYNLVTELLTRDL